MLYVRRAAGAFPQPDLGRATAPENPRTCVIDVLADVRCQLTLVCQHFSHGKGLELFAGQQTKSPHITYCFCTAIGGF